MSLSGTIGFLEANIEGSNVHWLCVVKSEEEKPPEIEVRRFRGKTVDKRHGVLALSEVNEGGASATTKNGVVRLTLTGKPINRANEFIWEIVLKTRPGNPFTRFVLGAQAGGQEISEDPLSQIAEVSATSLVKPQLNTGSQVVHRLKLRPIPRLSVGIHQAKPPATPPKYRNITPGTGDAANAASKDRKDLASFLYRIFFLLDSPGSLDNAWDQESLSKTTELLAAQKFTTDPIRTNEEYWARQVSEMLCFTTYGGPAASYSTNNDEALMTDGISRGTTNPCYGLSFACQHLASFGVVSRGFHRLTGTQLNAGSHCASTVTKMGGQWFTADTSDPKPLEKVGGFPASLGTGPNKVDIRETVAKISQYGPGCIHLFSNRRVRAGFNQEDRDRYEQLNKSFADGQMKIAAQASTLIRTTDTKGREVIKELNVSIDPSKDPARSHSTFLVTQDGKFLRDNQHNPHLGFVLRVSRRTDPKENKIQLLDTGGFGVAGRSKGVTAFTSSGFHSGIYDDPPTTTIKNGTHPFRGTGVFNRLTKDDAPKLGNHTKDVLEKARPLGLARLVLLDRNIRVTSVRQIIEKGALIYASPALTMYFNDSSADFEKSNYSITRYLWSLRDHPGSANTKAIWMIYIPRGALAKALISADRSESAIDVAKRIAGEDGLSKFLYSHCMPIADIQSEADGSVSVRGKIAKSKASSFHWLEINTLPLDKSFPEDAATDIILPPYFTV